MHLADNVKKNQAHRCDRTCLALVAPPSVGVLFAVALTIRLHAEGIHGTLIVAVASWNEESAHQPT